MLIIFAHCLCLSCQCLNLKLLTHVFQPTHDFIHGFLVGRERAKNSFSSPSKGFSFLFFCAVFAFSISVLCRFATLMNIPSGHLSNYSNMMKCCACKDWGEAHCAMLMASSCHSASSSLPRDGTICLSCRRSSFMTKRSIQIIPWAERKAKKALWIMKTSAKREAMGRFGKFCWTFCFFRFRARFGKWK